MQEKLNSLLDEINVLQPSTVDELENFRLKYLSRKGLLTDLFEEFKTVPNEQKREVGKKLNEVKMAAESKFNELKEKLENSADTSTVDFDLTAPGEPAEPGSRHPLSIVRNEIISIFSRIGYTVQDGQEIEDDWHNFSALNFPEEHPARDMQDTFFIDVTNKKNSIALRTHTSSVQVRLMESGKPPFRSIMPGRVFRNEAISARAHCIFHQVEGLYIDENVSFADLKQTLLYFAREMFGEKTQIRLRPSYFPFTEPSAEMDVSCFICEGKGCNICKYSGWVEILGCGMVDPNVLENCGIDSKKYTGFAFGMGIERITMLKYRINDLRLFFENDVRFLNQFKSAL
ncbi:MAG: phenylalanine--tRNA ligase subunit alpha [Bacteroidia bacterium]